MTIEELIVYGKKYLHSHEVNMLLSHILKYDLLELLNHLNEQVEQDKIDQFIQMVNQVKNQVPIQYMLGSVNFYGLDFKVNKNVLIPRFETEELVEYTMKYIERLFPNKDIDIIDLGCGSGNIGITLKKKIPNAKVSCIDISEEALIVAKENASSLQADITFIKSDMLDDIYSKFDVIISNPPYISPDEQIEDIVKNNEPNLALFADNNGLYFYEKILSTCEENLNEKFLIAFEIGMTQRDCVTELAHKYLNNVKIECKKDLSGKDRMIFIYNI